MQTEWEYLGAWLRSEVGLVVEQRWCKEKREAPCNTSGPRARVCSNRSGALLDMLAVVVVGRSTDEALAVPLAVQECVGRLGSFPHGIQILTAADYFTVSTRSTVSAHSMT